MEIGKSIKFFLAPLFLAGLYVFGIPTAFAYSPETHAYLTREIFNFYNQNSPEKQIPSELRDYLIDGSRREDDVPRWMNHFYDPVYNRGLTYDARIDPLYNVGSWQKSKDWAKDSNNQSKLIYKVPATIGSILTAVEQRNLGALSTDTNFTWQRAIELYVNGEEEKAMFVLGHVIHLIEDASVPDHTRNDHHPHDSPYENFTAKYNLSNPDSNLSSRLASRDPAIFSSLESYFDDTAKYSNNNFYSKDTIGIQSGYNSPQPVEYKVENGYQYALGRDADGEYFNLFKQKPGSSLVVPAKGEVIFNAPDIMSPYWSRLSTKSVESGAGVIDRFFKEVEAAKKDPNLVEKSKPSFVSQLVSGLKKVGSAAKDTFSKIFSGGDKELTEVIDLNQGSGSSNNKTGDPEISSPSVFLDRTKVARGETIVESGKGFSPSSDVLMYFELPNNKIASSTIKTDNAGNYQKSYKMPNDAVLGNYVYYAKDLKTNKLSNRISYSVVSGSAVSATSSTKEAKPAKEEPLEEEETKEPEATLCNFNTTSKATHQGIIINEVAWMGGRTTSGLTSNDEWIELKNISSQAINIRGWQLLDQGGQIEVVFGNSSIAAGKFYLLERTDDGSVPGVGADLIYTGALSNNNESLKLFDASCNLIDEVKASPNWPAGDAASGRTIQREKNFTWTTFGGNSSQGIYGTPKSENGPALKVEEEAAELALQTQGGGEADPISSTTLVIEEVIFDVEGPDEGGERITIFNPDPGSVNLSPGSIQYLAQGNDFSNIEKKNFEAGNSIGGGDGFIVGANCHSDTPCDEVDLSWSQALNNTAGTIFLVRDQIKITGLEDPDIIDEFDYEAEEEEIEEPEGEEEDEEQDNEEDLENPPEEGGVILEQTDQSTGSETLTRGGWNPFAWQQILSTEPGELEGVLGEITFQLEFEEGGWYNYSGYLYEHDDSECGDSTTGQVVVEVNEAPSVIATPVEITFPLNYEAKSNKCYSFIISQHGSTHLLPAIRVFGSTDPNSFSGGQLVLRNAMLGSPVFFTEDEAIKDAYFVLTTGAAPIKIGGVDGSAADFVSVLEISDVIFDVEGSDEGNERIFIDNLSDEEIHLIGGSIQYLAEGSDFSSIKKKNFEEDNQIEGDGQFVIGANCHGDAPCEDVDLSWSQALNNTAGTVYLVWGSEPITDENDADIIDSFEYLAEEDEESDEETEDEESGDEEEDGEEEEGSGDEGEEGDGEESDEGNEEEEGEEEPNPILFSQPDDSSEKLSGSGWFSLGSGSAGEASQLKIMAKLNETITENGRWYIGLFNIREDGESIWSVLNYPRPEQPKYCFNPADTDQFLETTFDFPEAITFEDEKFYEAYLVMKSSDGEFRVCENNDDVGGGNESSAVFRADPSGNIFFQIGTGL